jgi:hypothetical protein
MYAVVTVKSSKSVLHMPLELSFVESVRCSKADKCRRKQYPQSFILLYLPCFGCFVQLSTVHVYECTLTRYQLVANIALS